MSVGVWAWAQFEKDHFKNIYYFGPTCYVVKLLPIYHSTYLSDFTTSCQFSWKKHFQQVQNSLLHAFYNLKYIHPWGKWQAAKTYTISPSLLLYFFLYTTFLSHLSPCLLDCNSLSLSLCLCVFLSFCLCVFLSFCFTIDFVLLWLITIVVCICLRCVCLFVLIFIVSFSPSRFVSLSFNLQWPIL